MEMSDDFTTRILFDQLDDRRYSTYPELEAAVRDLFNAHRAAFPYGYTYRDAIGWARRQGWIVVDGNELVVGMTGAAA